MMKKGKNSLKNQKIFLVIVVLIILVLFIGQGSLFSIVSTNIFATPWSTENKTNVRMIVGTNGDTEAKTFEFDRLVYLGECCGGYAKPRAYESEYLRVYPTNVLTILEDKDLELNFISHNILLGGSVATFINSDYLHHRAVGSYTSTCFMVFTGSTYASKVYERCTTQSMPIDSATSCGITSTTYTNGDSFLVSITEDGIFIDDVKVLSLEKQFVYDSDKWFLNGQQISTLYFGHYGKTHPSVYAEQYGSHNLCNGSTYTYKCNFSTDSTLNVNLVDKITIIVTPPTPPSFVDAFNNYFNDLWRGIVDWFNGLFGA